MIHSTYLELGLTDELLTYLYWPTSNEFGIQLMGPMMKNHQDYDEKLRKRNISRNARFELAIK